MRTSRKAALTLLATSALVVVARPALATAPKTLSADQIKAIANDSSRWPALKKECDDNLNVMVEGGFANRDNSYAAAAWKDAANDYGVCYNVAAYLGNSADAANYSKKAIAIMKTMARDEWYGTPAPSYEFVAIADGSTQYPVRMAPVGSVTVYLATLTETAMTYDNEATNLPYTGSDNIVSVAKNSAIAKVSNTSGGPVDYTRGVDYFDGYYHMKWSAGKHPASGATYYISQADSFSKSTGASVNGTTLMFTSPPPSGQAIFVQYMGPDYEQTGNRMGIAQEGIRPDSTYFVRNITVGLATGYDLLRASPDLTTDLRTEFFTDLNAQIDFVNDMDTYDSSIPNDFYNPYLYHPELGNYTLEGRIPGDLIAAFATDDDNPRAKDSCTGDDCLKTLTKKLLGNTTAALDLHIPGGYGYEGTYNSGSFYDVLRVFDLWKRLAGEDLASPLQWTSNMVLAQIHGTKPDRATFYDGGDWNTLPAIPLVTALRGFVQFEATDKPLEAAYARQLLADIGSATSDGGEVTDYKSGSGILPLSFLAYGTGVLYARSDWNDANAVWLSMSVGPIYQPGHEHYDRGHFTFQRGADYLVINSGGYGSIDTLPFHNTLAFNGKSQNGGEDATKAVPTKYSTGSGFVYGEEDLTNSYDSGVAKRALRTLVYVQPNLVVVHDQVAGATACDITFNVNFNAAPGSLGKNGDIFSAVHGGSKVFMRGLVPANPAPAITSVDYDGGSANVSNYQTTVTSQTEASFLHLFQLAASSEANMVASTYLHSPDGKLEGVEVDAGTRRWAVMTSAAGGALQGTGTLGYLLPSACPCTHIVGDLPPNTTYQIDVAGGTPATVSAATDHNGVLTFSTDDAATSGVQIQLGTGVVDTTPPAAPTDLRIE